MTSHQILLSRRFLVYKFFANLWFVSAIWLYFYRLFISDAEVGVLDGVSFAIGLIAEVPSGALADRFGRDTLVRLGLVFTGTGFLIQAAGSSLSLFIAGQSILMIGISFVSGADEALFYDTLRFPENSAAWRKLMASVSQVTLIASMLATVLGGLLYQVHPRLPWVVTAVAFLISAAIVWKVADNRTKRQHGALRVELLAYLHSITQGFAAFRQRKLAVYLPLIVIVQGLLYTFDFGLLKLVLLDRFGFTTFAGALLIAACNLITVGLLWLMHRYAERLREKWVLSGISILAIASLVASIFDLGLWGILVVLVFIAGQSVLYTFMSDVLNYRTAEAQRATVLSVASFLRSLPYVALAPIIGYLNGSDNLELFLIVWAVLVAGALVTYVLLKRRDAVIPTQPELPLPVGEKVPELAA